MALFVFITDSCTKEAEKHGLHEDLERFRERIEKAQDYRQFDPFPPPYLVKKKFGGRQGRLVASLMQDVGGHSVVILLSYMIRGDAAYEDHFSTDPVNYGRKHFANLYTKSEIEGFVTARTAMGAPAPKSAPSVAEYGYLHQVLGQRPDNAQEAFICESIDWVQRTAEAPYKNRLESIFSALSDIEGDEGPGGKVTMVDAKAGVGVLTRSFPGSHVRLLVTPVTGTAGKPDRTGLATATLEILDADAPELSALLRASRRAYPALLLADLDLWVELEKDSHANLALSPEESQLLATARRPEGGFPLFINGRAGSGKTTILQYLFAEYLFYHLTTADRGPGPIYFTCNAELLAQSRKMVEKLLRCNSQWWQAGSRDQLVADNVALINEAFTEFHAHLLSLVPAKDRAARFSRDRHVSYSRFKRLWHERFGKEPMALREHGPDISWHVVRSYIKGLTPEVHLEPEEYRQLDEKEITVTQATYERVFDKVWTRWYKSLCEDQGYWDDQDVARYLIDADLVNPTYTAVFCDESQDFTRVELELLLRSSVYSQRKLEGNEVARVPFVFAGDQFQTLNPTGFRWDSIKASFVEKFIFALDPERRSRLSDLNYQELTLNYRSSRSIVCFSNFVQALRARLFDLTGLKPQQPWDREMNPPPVIGIVRENGDFWDRLKRERDIAIIVPCGEGEELDYIAQDAVLSQKIKVEDKVPDALVLSASRSKGLEFNRVVVYGFGESAEARGELLNPLKGQESYAGDPDRSLPFQYFINRLYVAVSRPKRRLFIVDSQRAFDEFWAFAHDEGMERAIFKGLRHGEAIWAKTVSRLEFGHLHDLSLDRTQDPKGQADELARQGRSNGDAFMLRYAAASYRNLNDAMEADRCRAEALQLDQNFIEAGRVFLKCGRVPEAVAALWRARREGGWKEMIAAAEVRPEINTRLEYAFARVVQDFTFGAATKVLQRLADRVQTPDGQLEVGGNPAWLDAMRTFMDKLQTTTAEQPTWANLAGLVNKIVQQVPLVTDSARAGLCFRADQMALAVELWERAKETVSRDYKIAKARSAPYPEKLTPLLELERFGEIVREYGANPEVALSGAAAIAAARAHLQEGLLDRALQLAVAGRKPELLSEICMAAAATKGNLLERALGAYFAACALAGDVGVFQTYAEKGVLRTRAVKPMEEFIRVHRGKVDIAWMRGLSRVPGLGDLMWDDRKAKHNKRPMADYLRKTFLADSGFQASAALVRDLGAAVELLGNRTDALSFYEGVMARPESPGLPFSETRERWIVCKERQAVFESARGDEKQARVLQAEADDARRRLNLPPGTALASYPNLGTPDELLDSCLATSFLAEPAGSTPPIVSAAVTAALGEVFDRGQSQGKESIRQLAVPLPPKSEFVVGGLKLEFFRATGKLQISNPADGATASFRRASSAVNAIDVEVKESGPGSGILVVEEWALKIDRRLPDRLTIHKEGVSLSLPWTTDESAEPGDDSSRTSGDGPAAGRAGA